MPKSIAHPIPVRLTLPSEVVRVAKVSAEGTNTDFKSLLASSLSESHHDPAATNKRSTATGAYQMTERTWLDLMRRHGAEVGQGDAAAKITTVDGAPTVTDPADRAAILALRNNSALAGALAARYSDENRTHLGKILGHPPTENQVRMAYPSSQGGAERARHDGRQDLARRGEEQSRPLRAARRRRQDRKRGRGVARSPFRQRPASRQQLDQREAVRRQPDRRPDRRPRLIPAPQANSRSFCSPS
jgi:hypothetical protein